MIQTIMEDIVTDHRQSHYPVCFEDEDLIIVQQSYYRWGIVTKAGQIIVPFKYRWIERRYTKGLIRAIDNYDMWGMFDRKGNIVLPFTFKHINRFNDKSNTIWAQTTKAELQFSLCDLNPDLRMENEGNLEDKLERMLMQRNVNDEYNTHLSFDDDAESGYIMSVVDNPFYNENLDLDQQSIEFWNCY